MRASGKQLTPDLAGLRRLPEDGASKQGAEVSSSQPEGCVCVSALVPMCPRVCSAGAWVTARQCPGTSQQAEGAVCVEVRADRKHVAFATLKHI